MKTKKSKISAIVSGACAVLFVAFTLIVKFVDVEPIGPEGTSVGLAALNKAASDALGFNRTLYDVTDWLGVVALAAAVAFAVIGVVQLIRRKSLKKVDFEILALGVFYIVVAAFYVFFELAIVNYRPIILGAAPEASYPSSHTVLAVCVLGSAIVVVHRKLNSRPWRIAAESAFAALAVVIVVGRLLSGAHWLTDIIGGLLLSAALVSGYIAALAFRDERVGARNANPEEASGADTAE